jgi:hypothetical protein
VDLFTITPNSGALGYWELFGGGPTAPGNHRNPGMTASRGNAGDLLAIGGDGRLVTRLVCDFFAPTALNRNSPKLRAGVDNRVEND